MRNILIGSLVASLSLVSMVSAHAENTGDRRGPYTSLSLGVSRFNVDKTPSTVSNDVNDGSLKLVGGYNVTQYFGAEVGFIRGGDIVAKRSVGSSTVTQTAKVRSLYVAGTARLPISDKFSVNGKIGVARGEVTSNTALPASETLAGKKTSLMAGIGAQYQLTNHWSIVSDFDRIHKVANRVSANTLTVGVRADF